MIMSANMFITWKGGGGRGLFLNIGRNQEKNPHKKFDPGRMLELIYKSLYV